jgi:hypothetical protein
MYKFKKTRVNWLNFNIATPEKGCFWKKSFLKNTTPINQFSLNIYSYGMFDIYYEDGSFSQTVSIGNSNLDLKIKEFPTDQLVIETPLLDQNCRWCITTVEPTKWIREKYYLDKHKEFNLSKNQIAVIIPTSGWYCTEPLVFLDKPFYLEDDSYIFKLSLPGDVKE